MKIRITCLLLVILGVVVNCSGVHEHNKKQGFYSLNEVLSFKSQLHHKDDDKVDIVALQDNQFATVVEFEGGKYAIQVKEYFKNACFINPGTTTSHLLSDSDRSKSLSGIYRASSTLNAFAGLTKDGSVFTCGVDGDFGGNSELKLYLQPIRHLHYWIQKIKWLSGTTGWVMRLKIDYLF